jgi:3-hydroxymyristoyl/3-hydroxydecanoyl-(acyl carrier protein) dehydratase
MKENQITGHFSNHPVLPGLIETLNAEKSGKIIIDGLSGSSRALVLALVFQKTQTTHVVIIP